MLYLNELIAVIKMNQAMGGSGRDCCPSDRTGRTYHRRSVPLSPEPPEPVEAKKDEPIDEPF
jgi:hypothetical protein